MVVFNQGAGAKAEASVILALSRAQTISETPRAGKLLKQLNIDEGILPPRWAALCRPTCGGGVHAWAPPGRLGRCNLALGGEANADDGSRGDAQADGDDGIGFHQILGLLPDGQFDIHLVDVSFLCLF